MKIEVDAEEWCSPKCPRLEMEEEHFYGALDDVPLITMRSCKHLGICRNAVRLYKNWNEGRSKPTSNV